MLRKRISNILRLALASLSFGAHLAANVQPAVAEGRVDAAESCFVGVDYTQISVSALSVLVERYVATMRGRGASDVQIVQTLGFQMSKGAQNCSRGQVAGLLRNVGLILANQGFRYSPGSMTATLQSSFAQRPGTVEGRSRTNVAQEDSVASDPKPVY